MWVNMGGTAVERHSMAAFEPANGSNIGVASSFDTNADDTVFAIAVSGTTVYAGGTFTAISRRARMNCAAINLTTGRPTAWDPSAGTTANTVFAIKVAGSRIYIGGNFTTVNALAHNYLAVVAPVTGIPDPGWNLSPSTSPIRAIEATSTTVFAGGDFGGAVNMVALSASDGFFAPSPWIQPATAYPVNALLLSGNILYIGDGNGTVGNVYAVNATTGSTVGFTPSIFGNSVYSLALSGGRLFAGGAFSAGGGNGLAALNASNGNYISSWNPYTDSGVYALAPYESTLYIGGPFNSINSFGQAYLGALSVSDPGGLIAGFTPVFPGGSQILTITISNGAVYAGGNYLVGGSSSARGFAAFDSTTGEML